MQKEFVVHPEKPLDGIIAYLTNKHGGNVHTKGIVKCSASSVEDDDPFSPDDLCDGAGEEEDSEDESDFDFLTTAPRHAVDFVSDFIFCSEDEPDSFLCYDFRPERRVAPTSYSIQSSGQQTGCHHPKSWVFEVSNDAVSWKVIDTRNNVDDLNDFRVTRNFAITSPDHESYRFVRLRQTGTTWRGTNNLVLSALELFGMLTE